MKASPRLTVTHEELEALVTSSHSIVTMRFLAALVALSVFFGLPSVGPSQAEGSEGGPVVLVTFDEFPTTALMNGSNRISRKRFPNFSRLADGAVWYPNNSTPSPFTSKAVPSILTGLFANKTYPDFREYPQSLYTLMNSAGYSIRNLETYSQLCPPTICSREGRPVIDPRPSESAHDFGMRVLKQVSGRAAERIRWIEGLANLGAREAAIGHILLPHGPYSYLPNGRQYRDLERFRVVQGPRRIIRSSVPGLLESYEKRLLMQVGYVDRLVGRIMNAIKRSGRWDETTLVVTSDHGVSIKPGMPRRDAVAGNRFSVGLTPLFIKYPGQASGIRSGSMTSSVDIVPTIARNIGIDSSLYEVDGISTSEIPGDRTTGILNRQDDYLQFDRTSIAEWLEGNRVARTRRMGTRGLNALGPVANLIGRRPGKATRVSRSGLLIPALKKTRARASRRLPPLIEGYIKGRSISIGTRLLLSLRGRVAATSTVFNEGNTRAFSFVLHPRFLKRFRSDEIRFFQRARAN